MRSACLERTSGWPQAGKDHPAWVSTAHPSRADDAQAPSVSKGDYQIPEGLSDLRQKTLEAALTSMASALSDLKKNTTAGLL